VVVPAPGGGPPGGAPPFRFSGSQGFTPDTIGTCQTAY
jgi:hypothetical protein